MAIRAANSLRQTWGNSFVSAVGVNGLCRFYTNAQVGTFGGSEAGNTLVAEVIIPNPGFTVAANGTVTLQGVWNDAANNTGTISHAVITTAGGTAILDGSVTATPGSGDFQLVTNVVQVVAQQVALTAFTLTFIPGQP
jgi:hypothetical protein